MFATIRKHQTWLWAIIIGVIIISFVIFFSPNVSFDRGTNYDFGSIGGKPITREDYSNAYREAQLRYLFSYGSWPKKDETTRQFGFDAERETMNRLYLTYKIRENKINVSDSATVRWIQSVPFFQDRERKGFRPEIYEQFIKTVLNREGFVDTDMERFARHEVGIQELISIYGAAGKLTTPREAEALLLAENEEFQTQVVVFNLTNYMAKVTINPADLTQFYSNRLSAYRIPERAQVAYVSFQATNFLADADKLMAADTNLTLKINQEYVRQGTNLFVDADGKPMSEVSAKEKIRKGARESFALQTARKKAGEYGTELDQVSKKLTLADFKKFAESKGMTVKETEPFSQSDAPKDILVNEGFIRSAFALTVDEPVLPTPVMTENAIYVMALVKKLPSEVPTLDAVKDKVTEDFRYYQAATMCRQAGYAFSMAATNGLASGKTFAALCEASDVKPLEVPKFSQRTASVPEIEKLLDLSRYKETVAGVGAGKSTSFIPTREGGFVAFVQARTPADSAKIKTELATFVTNVRKTRQYMAFSEWVTQEMGVDKVSTAPKGNTKATK